MDIFGLDIASISLIELFRILIKLFDLLAAKGNSEFEKGLINKNDYVMKSGENSMLFACDLYDRTVNFLKNNFEEMDLLQICEMTNWKKKECLKEEPPKQSQNRSHTFR